VFDPKSEAHEFIGADRAEAVEAACRFFDAEESDLTIAELEPQEVSGLGARAVVVALPVGAPPPSREPEGERGRGRDRDRGGRGRDRERGDRGRDRGGRGRGRGGRDRDRGGRSEERASATRPAPETIDEPSEGTARGELGELGQFVQGVVERMKLGGFEISESEEDDLIVIQLTGNAAVRLSQAETRVGDAIQLLANQVSIKGGREGPRIVVDVEGDRARRDAYLEQLASRACDRAQSTSRAVALDPMNGKDRRTIHMALRDVDGVATMSVGEGQYRQVVVVPEGAPEYEEARRKADEAASAGD
jgi:predicted RNA-binding protein Jag